MDQQSADNPIADPPNTDGANGTHRWRWYLVGIRVVEWMSGGSQLRYLGIRPMLLFLARADGWLRTFDPNDTFLRNDPTDPLYNLIPPDNESAVLPRIWVCEIYLPSHVGTLARDLARQGWHRRDWGSDPEQALRQKLADARVDGALGWSRLATIWREGSSAWRVPGSSSGRMPQEFERVDMTMIALCSSLTVLVAEFHLTDDAQASLETAVRRPHAPRVFRGWRSNRYENARQTGIVDVHHTRSRLHALARGWLAQRLPGAFAEDDDPHLPVMDLMIRHVSRPLAPRDDPALGTYEDALGLHEILEAECLDFPGLHLMDYSGPESRRRYRDAWALFGCYDELATEHKGYDADGFSDGAIAYRANHVAPDLLARLAIGALLQQMGRRQAAARDQALATHRRRPIASSKKLRETLLRDSMDLLSVRSDLLELTAKSGAYRWNVSRFTVREARWLPPAASGQARMKAYDLLNSMRKQQRAYVRRLGDCDTATRDVLSTATTISASVDSMRSQRVSLLVAVASAALAAIAIVIALTATHSP